MSSEAKTAVTVKPALTIRLLPNNYRLIVALRKFDVLKTTICLRNEASREKWAIFKNIKFSRGNYQTDSRETWTLYCSPLNFLPRASWKVILNYFQHSVNWKPWKPNEKFEKGSSQKPTNCLFSIIVIRLVYRKISRTSTIHPGIFLGRALSADSCPAEIWCP